MSGERGAPAGPVLDEHRLQRLVEVGRGLVSELDLEVVLNRLLEVGRELTSARYAALGILDSSRRGLERFLFLGIDERTRQAIGDLPRGHGVLGLLIETPEPLRLSDVGSHPRSYGFPPGHPEMRSFLGVPVKIRGEAFGNLYLTEKEGGEFTLEDEQSAVVLADWAGIAIENARLYTEARVRGAELERAVRGLEATLEIARAVGAETDLDRVLSTIAKRARALVSARSLVVLLETGGRLEVVVTAGELDRRVRGERLEPGSALERTMREGRTERVGDAHSRVGITPGDLGVDASSALLVPLRFQGRPLGLIAAFDRGEDGPEFKPEDERLLISFAASAATAVATAQSVANEQLRQSIEASERERSRWARELHDETLQGLGALRLMLSSAQRRGSPEAISAALSHAVDQLATEIANLRSLITELRPAALDELGLEAAIESLCDQHAVTTGLDVRPRISLGGGADHEALDAERESALYRVIQEALTNVAKHARAERVDLVVETTDGAVDVLVRDDGVGFDPGEPREGFGLVGMEERIALVGGRLEVNSAAGAGTEVRATLPLRRSARSAAERLGAL